MISNDNTLALAHAYMVFKRPRVLGCDFGLLRSRIVSVHTRGQRRGHGDKQPKKEGTGDFLENLVNQT